MDSSIPLRDSSLHTALAAITLLLVAFSTSRADDLQRDTLKESVIRMDRAELKATMADVLQKGYDPTVITNSSRFFADVVFIITQRAHARDPQGDPILIGHEDWFRSFVESNGLSDADAPLGVRLAFQNRQDILIDYRGQAIVKKSGTGVYPEFALNVQLSWPQTAESPDQYSFEDTTSTPKVRVTSKKLIRFRLLDFGDMIVYDEIEGITGRPISGLLAPLFSLIGDGRLVWSRLAVAGDGTQLAYAKAQKGFFSVTETVSIRPNGVASKGVSNDSPELVALAERLDDDIEIEYQDWPYP